MKCWRRMKMARQRWQFYNNMSPLLMQYIAALSSSSIKWRRRSTTVILCHSPATSRNVKANRRSSVQSSPMCILAENWNWTGFYCPVHFTKQYVELTCGNMLCRCCGFWENEWMKPWADKMLALPFSSYFKDFTNVMVVWTSLLSIECLCFLCQQTPTPNFENEYDIILFISNLGWFHWYIMIASTENGVYSVFYDML